MGKPKHGKNSARTKACEKYKLSGNKPLNKDKKKARHEKRLEYFRQRAERKAANPEQFVKKEDVELSVIEMKKLDIERTKKRMHKANILIRNTTDVIKPILDALKEKRGKRKIA